MLKIPRKMQTKNDYFGSESPLSGPSSSASPSSAMLSPGSSSVATSQLSLLNLESQRNSPSTSACTSVSDLSSEADKLSLSKADKAAALIEEPETEEDSEAAAIEAENRRVEEELDSALAFGTQIVQREARALAMAAKRLSKLSPQQDGFRQAVRLVMRATSGGQGRKGRSDRCWKAGLIARRSFRYVHVTRNTIDVSSPHRGAAWRPRKLLTPHRDVVIALSHSGSSPEILALLPHLNARKCPIIALVGKKDSVLVRASDAWIDCHRQG